MFVELALLAALTYVATLLGTATGFGISTVMVPVLLLFFPPLETLLFVGIIHWFGDIWKMLLFRTGADWKFILRFGIPGVVFSYLGASVVLGAPEFLLSRALGVALLAYIVFLLAFPKFRLKKRTPTVAFGGALSGFVVGLFGFGGEVRSSFLTAFDLKKAPFLFTNGAVAFFIDSTRIATYAIGGTRVEPFLLYGLLLFIPVSFLGAMTAKAVLGRVPEKQFRYLIAFFLALVGIKLLFFP